MCVVLVVLLPAQREVSVAEGSVERTARKLAYYRFHK